MFWCVDMSHIYIYLIISSFTVQIIRQNIQGLSSNNFYALPTPPNKLQKGKYTYSYLHIFYKIHNLKNFKKFTEKHHCWSHSLIKLQVSRPEIWLKRDTCTRIFLWKFLRNFSKNINTSEWLLLQIFAFKARFYSLITSFLFIPSFFPFIIGNCNYGSLFGVGLKMNF